MNGLDLALEVGFQAALYEDYRQTRQIVARQEYHETNTLLGKHPSLQRVKNYMLGASIGHWVISELLPQGKYRTLWQASTLVIEANQVRLNLEIGLK